MGMLACSCDPTPVFETPSRSPDTVTSESWMLLKVDYVSSTGTPHAIASQSPGGVSSFVEVHSSTFLMRLKASIIAAMMKRNAARCSTRKQARTLPRQLPCSSEVKSLVPCDFIMCCTRQLQLQILETLVPVRVCPVNNSINNKNSSVFSKTAPVKATMMDPVQGSELLCYINGKRQVLPTGRAETTLLQYLRGVFDAY